MKDAVALGDCERSIFPSRAKKDEKGRETREKME